MNHIRSIQKASAARRHLPVFSSSAAVHAQRPAASSNPLFLSGLQHAATSRQPAAMASPHAAKAGGGEFSEPSLLSLLDAEPSKTSSASSKADSEYIIVDDSSSPHQAVFKQVSGEKPKGHPIFADDSVVVDGDL